jgi:hypothetical protein
MGFDLPTPFRASRTTDRGEGRPAGAREEFARPPPVQGCTVGGPAETTAIGREPATAGKPQGARFFRPLLCAHKEMDPGRGGRSPRKKPLTIRP